MGIEKYYDATIRGKEGSEDRIIDVNMNMIDQKTRQEAVSGNPLVLSIDKEVQELAYDLIGDGTGAVIVSRPATGEVIALVSKPSFDPNIFTDRFTMEEFFVLKNNVDKPFLNRAVQGSYPPGSVFKIVTASALLQKNLQLNKIINCPGYMKIGNRIFNCWERGGHGNLGFIGAIANSCDVYFYTMGLLVGKDDILQFAQNYGLNKKTEIDIPGETTGLVPDPETFKKKYDRPWQNGDTANISIGQGDLLTTPIGINVLTMSVANNGVVYKPYILKQIYNAEDQKVLWERRPEVLRKVNLSPENFDLIRQGMNGVATYGTGKWLKAYTDVPMAAKSGTVEVGKEKETHAWYTAFAPYGDTNLDDMIAVTVVMEHGGGGSAVAGPVVAKIIDYYFKNKVNYKANAAKGNL